MTEGERVRNAESLSACQMVKNVIRTRMEMRRKLRNSIVGRIAKKLISKNRMVKGKVEVKKRKNCGMKQQQFVVDLNVNVNFKQ